MLIIYWILSALLIGVDQLIKWWITDNLALGETKSLIPGTSLLDHIRNTEAAWGMPGEKMWFLTIMTLITVVVILTLMIKNREEGNHWFMIGSSLTLVGAIGNFIDRTRLGYVVDTFQTDSISSPIFNVADATLICGVICMLIHIISDGKD